MDNLQQQNNIEIDNEKMWAIVAYFIFFLPLLIVKNRSSFLNYHINQGLILFIFGFVGNIVINTLNLYIFSLPYSLIIIVLAVMGIMNVNKNEMKPLPLIGGLLNLIK
jgi:uncharacterized membrane protein